MINRREFIRTSALIGGGVAGALGAAGFGPAAEAVATTRPWPAFEFEEATLADLQAAMRSGRATAASLVRAYRTRIERMDREGPRVNAVIELNPDAMAIARDLDRERARGRERGPLHGVPVLVKDNIDTGDRMMTTAGSLALVGSVAARDAWLVERLRAAGAVILGKTNLSEWANFRGHRSTSGWSARGGQTRNPYVLDRNPSGSSSGSAAAVAASFCAVAVGTETDGSIISPSSFCGIVGIKPTVGLIGRSGIIPISATQDTAGPMARTVTDAAVLLGVLAGEDPRDVTTQAGRGRVQADYTRFLDASGLRGARIGVARRYFNGARRASEVMESALRALREAGAVLVDPAEVPSPGDAWGLEETVLCYEFKVGLNAYLAGLAPGVAVRSLQDVIEFNERNRDRELAWFGQELLVKCEALGPSDEPAYREALARSLRGAREEGIDAVMDQHGLDALVAPSGGPAHVTDYVHGGGEVGGSSSPAARAGYPSITVPAGWVKGLPVGLSFFGRAWSEPVLLRLAFAFEQATRARRPPGFLPTLG